MNRVHGCMLVIYFHTYPQRELPVVILSPHTITSRGSDQLSGQGNSAACGMLVHALSVNLANVTESLASAY